MNSDRSINKTILEEENYLIYLLICFDGKPFECTHSTLCCKCIAFGRILLLARMRTPLSRCGRQLEEWARQNKCLRFSQFFDHNDSNMYNWKNTIDTTASSLSAMIPFWWWKQWINIIWSFHHFALINVLGIIIDHEPLLKPYVAILHRYGR